MDQLMEHIYQNCWTIHARVQWKAQIKENGMGNIYLQCILLDQEGTKMEAIAFNNQSVRFNTMLRTGICYEFIRVGFNPTEIPDGHFWYLAMEFVMTLDTRTEVRMSVHRIASTICPLGFPQFGAIFSLRDKRTTDVIAILAYVGKIESLWDPIYGRHIPFLEIGLMNFRRQIIFLCIYDEHVGRQFYHLRRTENQFEVLAVTCKLCERARSSILQMLMMRVIIYKISMKPALRHSTKHVPTSII